MTGDRPPPPDELPLEAQELHRLLESVRFNPRASLEPEIYARLRRGDEAAEPPARPWRVQLPLAGAVALLGTALTVVLLAGRDRSVRIDHCCWDLDGGGVADDGVLVIAGRDERIRSLRIYEDTDGNGRWSDGDTPRLSPDGPAEPPGVLAAGLSTRQFCCLDYDAGGADDDGIFVLGTPPDRVFLAAVYEDRDGTGEVSAADILRYVVR